MIYANQPLRAAVKSVEELLRKIKTDRSIKDIESLIVPVSHVFSLQGVPELKEKEKKYM